MKIRYTGKFEDVAGILKVSMGIKNFADPFEGTGGVVLSLDNLEDNPAFWVFNTYENIIIVYKPTLPEFNTFGPYSPYLSIPYFIVYGEGITANSSFFVEVKITIEGIVNPSQADFA